MHIQFKHLTIHNFMSLADAELRFENDGFIRVSGINENPDDTAGSNGSGKSSLWEALIWSLTGDTIRGTKQVVTIGCSDGCFVEIEFVIDAKTYHIIRSKDHSVRKTNLQIFIDGQDVSGKGIRDSERLLQQYLPDITASLLGSVIVLGQGLPQKFTNNTPSGRKEVLEKLSKSDFMIEDLKSRVNTRKGVLTQELRAAQDAILSAQASVALLTSQIADANKHLESLNKTDLINQKNSLLSEVNVLTAQLSEQENLLQDTLAKHQEIATQKATISSDETAEMFTLKSNYDTETAPLISLKQEHSVHLNTKIQELHKLKSITDICPTCGQKLSDVHVPDTASLENEVEALQQNIKDIDKQLRQAHENYDAAIRSVSERYRVHKLSLNSQFTEIASKCNEIRQQKDSLSHTLSMKTTQYNSTEVELAQLDAKIAHYTNVIRDNNESLTDLENQILYNNKQRDLTNSHLDVISKFDTALKRDFRGHLLSTVIAFIEDRAKYYSTIIFDNKCVTFALDGNNIDIRYCGRAYENLSGGEKQKIDLIIQFSIRDMLSTQLGFTSNILILDEVFDGLDGTGCTRVIDMIASLSDIKNIFIVTHRKDLSIPCDKELVVVKSPAGISRIQNT